VVGPDVGRDFGERMRAKRDGHAAARAIYQLAGAAERRGRFEFTGGHFFPPEERGAAYAWLKRWLA
jgi:hypothetical protein